MRNKKLAWNTISGLLLQVTTVLCGFVLPRAILNRFGSDVNGLLNSIAQFLQMIAFLELGVGAVVQSALYRPLAEGDSAKISEVLSSGNNFFRKLGSILVVYVAALVVVFPLFVDDKFGFAYDAALILSMSISHFAQYYFGIVDKLLLKADLFDDADGRALLTAKLTALGISEERFELRGFSFNYLPEYYDMDIALDTFPYPGGGTTCDALYMGVPVITLGDGSHGGDFGISLLQNIGLDIACAFSVAEYIEKAKLLAGDFELLDALHLGLRNMMENSPLMDQAAYMRELEAGYREIWQAYLG